MRNTSVCIGESMSDGPFDGRNGERLYVVRSYREGVCEIDVAPMDEEFDMPVFSRAEVFTMPSSFVNFPCDENAIPCEVL